MSSQQALAILFLVLGLGGIWLVYNDKLTPVIEAILTSNGTTGASLGKVAVAFVIFALIIGLLPQDAAILFVVALIIAALYVNVAKNKSQSVIGEIT